MKRKLISMFIALFTMVYGAKAKIVEKTVWEGNEAISWNTEAYPGTQFEAPSGTFTGLAKDDVVKIYTTTNYENPDYVVTYKKGDGWTWTDLATTITEGVISFTVADDTQATEIAERGLILRGQAWTATKITISTEEADDPIPITTLWSGTKELGEWTNFEALRYEGKGELANAKVGDIIRVTLESILEGSQIYVCDAASYVEFANGYFNPAPADETYVEYMVTDAFTMKSICDKGIVVKGKLATLTKIELITSDDSYDAIGVTIGEDGIATFSSAKHHSFAAAGITPYYASEVGLGSVTLTSIEDKTTWKYQGYILKGMPGSYTIPVVESDDDATYPSSTNYLKATEEYERTLPQEGEENKYIYIFAKDGEDIGFYYLNGKNYTLAAHRAYLLTESDIRPASGARVALNFDDGDPTAVVSVGESKQDNVYYNLNGMRVTNPSKGVYVVNGKKVIIK